MPRGRSTRILLSFACPLLFVPLPVAASPPLPAEVQNVSLFSATVSWDASAGAVAYRVYRADLADLPNFCAGASSLTTGTDFDDLQVPPVGGVFVYLVTAVNSAGEGSAGQSSVGAPRDGSSLCDSDSDGVPDDTDLCPDDADPNQDDLDLDGVGDACQFDASGVQLSGRIPLRGFPIGFSSAANEMWGYVSPAGEEYGIIGFRNGTAFVRVTNPLAPGLAGYIDGAGVNQTWRDMAVFGEYAYIISDGAGVGLQIVDLTGIDNDVITLANTTTLGVGFNGGHNVFINESSGFLYLGIPDLDSGLGLTAVDLNTDPVDPTVAGTWEDTEFGVRCHDFQVLSYTSGPFAGREIAYCFAEDDGLRIVDVTSKTGMFRLAKLFYPNTTYSHQGWITEDRQYLLIGDELDERDVPAVSTTTTYVVDVSDPSAPVFTTSFTNGLPAIDHNLMVRGDFVYQANYSSGLRIFSICNINNVQEIGHLDTHPESDGTVFVGAWGVYSRLPSGTVMVSDIQRGLFVLEPSSALARVNDKCSSLSSHDPVCDPCIDQICTQDPSCCTTAWDAQCIESVRTLCGSLICDESAGSCAHTLCSEGEALTEFCDTPPAATSCVDAICEARPSCCSATWDSTCVALVDSACGQSCD